MIYELILGNKNLPKLWDEDKKKDHILPLHTQFFYTLFSNRQAIFFSQFCIFNFESINRANYAT